MQQSYIINNGHNKYKFYLPIITIIHTLIHYLPLKTYQALHK